MSAVEVDPRVARVLEWSARIHPRGGDRDRWAAEAAAAILDGREPPRFPSRIRSTHDARVDTVRRLLARGAR